MKNASSLPLLLSFGLVNAIAASTTGQEIRGVKFSEHTFGIAILAADEAPTFKHVDFARITTKVTLKEGRATSTEPAAAGWERAKLISVSYGDVTGDRKEEAIVHIAVNSGGSLEWGFIYVFRLAKNRLELLSCFMTGHRADSGYRAAYADNGDLLIEIYVMDPDRGDCCPTQMKQLRFTWKGSGFVLNGEPIILPLSPRE